MAALINKDDVRKLPYEILKWAVLGICAFLVTAAATRFTALGVWLSDAFGTLTVWSTKTTTIPNSFLALIALCALAFLAVAGQTIITWLGPTYLRQFREGEYDSIVWRWTWRGRTVNKATLLPHCRKCGTELRLTAHATEWIQTGATQHMRPDVRAFCSACNTNVFFSNVDDLLELVRLKIEGDARGNRWHVTKERVPPNVRLR